MHHMDKPNRQLPSKIQGKTSVTDTKKHWCFPLASAGAEAVAAAGCSLKWSRCFYCSCQSETSWVFGRAWTGARHLLLKWDNCACGLLGHKDKCVGGEQGSAVCGQLWGSEPQWKAASTASQPQWVQHLWHRYEKTHTFVTQEIPCHLCRQEQSCYRCSLFSTSAFCWWTCVLLRIFNPKEQIVQFEFCGF